MHGLGMERLASLARRYGDAWAASDTEAFVAMFTPDAVYRDDQVGRLSRGHDDLRAFHSHFAAAISDICMEFPTLFGDGEHVCLEWTFSGRQTGTYHGRPPSGRLFHSSGVAVMLLAADGLIRSVTDYYDGAAVQRQLAVT